MDSNKSRKILIGVIGFVAGIIVTSAVVFTIMCGIGNMAFVNKDDYKLMSQFYEEYEDLAAVDFALEEYYYKDVKEGSLVEDACKGAVSALNDPYSAYMNVTEYESYRVSSRGSYSGVGITFTSDKDGNYVVESVTAGAPASKTDIAPGDIMLKVNGKSYKEMDVFASKLRGYEGTKVDLTYLHNGKEKTVTLTRSKIKQKSIESKVLDDDIGYIKISEFINNTGDDFAKALKKVEGKGCDKIILDLRDNGGGLVDAAVSVADQFLDDALVVSLADKHGITKEYRASNGKTDSQLVVLVNNHSASSSEILAGALQDHGFDIVGEKTYGKGVVQSNIDFKDGTSLKLTIAQYMTPNGHKVHKKGITPDYKVKSDKDHDYQLDKAIELLNK